MSSDPKYVISLDAIDLNYLPVYPHRAYDNIVPIWTTSNLDSRNDEYVEFEIKDRQELKSEDKSNVINYDKIWCHICNVGIPDIFIKEHIESSKHRINMTIVNVALKRAKASNNMLVDCKKEAKNHIYFCTSCVVIVDIKDKINHNNSQNHRNAVSIDKVLENFLFLYANYDTATGVTEIHDQGKINDLFEESTSTETSNSNFSNENNTANKQIHCLTSIANDQEPNLEFNSILNDKKQCVNKNTLDSKYFLHSNDSINNNTELAENHGKTNFLVITQNAESKFSQVNTNSKATEDNCLNPNDPIIGINNNTLLNDMSQCVHKNTLDSKSNEQKVQSKICNIENKPIHNLYEKKQSAENTDSSVSDDRSLERFIEVESTPIVPRVTNQDFLLSKLKESKPSPKNCYFCKVCKVSVPNTDSCRLEHNLGTNHMCNISTVYKISLKIHYHMIYEIFQLHCVVCDVKVTLNDRNMNEHVEGRNHVTQYNNIIVKNQLKQVNDRFYCEICNINIIPKHELVHSITKEHIRKLNLVKK